MTEIEKLFNASQYMLMQCVGKLYEIHGYLKDVNIYSAGSTLEFLESDLQTLRKIIAAMEDEEYGDREQDDEIEEILRQEREIEDEDEEYSTSSLESSSSSESSSSDSTSDI